jgi:hypothetical protein
MLADRILMSIREAKKGRARSKLQKIALHSVERDTFQAAVPALVSEIASAKAAAEAPKHLKRILFSEVAKPLRLWRSLPGGTMYGS